MSKLSTKILDKIKKEKVTPKPRWYFMVMHTLLGTAILTSIIIGSIAVAIVIRHFTLTDWELTRKFSGSHIRSFFIILPYIWLIFIGLVIFIAESLFKHTKKGYKTESWKLAAASVALSVILGALFYWVEVDRPIEEGLRQNIPPYAQWEERQNQMFAAPERGVLAGEIIQINPHEQWMLLDFRNEQWLVDVSDAMMNQRIPFAVGMKVGMTGQVTGDAEFKAERVAPWRREIKIIDLQINERNF